MKDVTLNQREQARLQVLGWNINFPGLRRPKFWGSANAKSGDWRPTGGMGLPHWSKEAPQLGEDVAATTVGEKYNHSHLTEVLAEQGIQLSRQDKPSAHDQCQSSPQASCTPGAYEEGMLQIAAAIIVGWRTEGPDSYCCWQWTTPPAG